MNTQASFSQKHQHAQYYSRQIEAILHASESLVSAKQLKTWLNLKQDELELALMVLQERLSAGALTLSQTASGYRLQIANDFSPLIQQIFPERREHLSQALLETLTIIAYKQPVTRADIEQVRGVSVSSHILRQLFDKGWIVERGFKDTLGKPALLYTTPTFLDAFNLTDLNQLPPLPEMTHLNFDTIHHNTSDGTNKNN